MPDPWSPSDRSVGPIPKGKDRLFRSITTGNPMFSPSGITVLQMITTPLGPKFLSFDVNCEEPFNDTLTSLKIAALMILIHLRVYFVKWLKRRYIIHI